MKLTVPVNHNYYEESPMEESDLAEKFHAKKSGTKNIKELFSTVYELKLGAEQLKQIKIYSFKKKSFFEADEERLILKLYSKEQNNTKKYFVQTGLYAGTLYHKAVKINITTKYGDAFLKRML